MVKHGLIEKNAIVIANALTLGSEVILETMGGDISDTLAGSQIKLDLLHTAIAERIKKNLQSRTE